MKIVLIWASANIFKYWNVILKDLTEKWHTVFPVNPKKSEIRWIKCYKDISEIKEDFDVINFVTPPEVTLAVLKEANDLWYRKVWCQPWSTDENVLKYLKENKFDYIADACIMMENIG